MVSRSSSYPLCLKYMRSMSKSNSYDHESSDVTEVL